MHFICSGKPYILHLWGGYSSILRVLWLAKLQRRVSSATFKSDRRATFCISCSPCSSIGRGLVAEFLASSGTYCPISFKPALLLTLANSIRWKTTTLEEGCWQKPSSSVVVVQVSTSWMLLFLCDKLYLRPVPDWWVFRSNSPSINSVKQFIRFGKVAMSWAEWIVSNTFRFWTCWAYSPVVTMSAWHYQY